MSNYKLVNWDDTMGLSAQHFIDTDNYFIELIRDASHLGLTSHNFGLLPARSGGNAYNGIRISDHITDRIEIQMHSCDAITPSGIRIRYNVDGQGEPLVKSYSPADDRNVRNRNATQWDILISVNPFEREPTGELDPQETPPRHPYGESRYELLVMPAGDINTMEFGSHYLTIGRIRKDRERYAVDKNFIPPCASMTAHPDLADYYNTFGVLFSTLEKTSKHILEKIHSRADKTDLPRNIKLMCEDMLRYIASIYFDFRNKGRFAPPINSVGYISTLAHQCYVSLTSMPPRQKEELLKYFSEWGSMKPGELEAMLSSMLDTLYEHDNIRAVMVQCEIFMQNLINLWERLSRLEYIGQRKENIVVSESATQSEPSTARGWGIVDGKK